jgi:hypothetical protein
VAKGIASRIRLWRIDRNIKLLHKNLKNACWEYVRSLPPGASLSIHVTDSQITMKSTVPHQLLEVMSKGCGADGFGQNLQLTGKSVKTAAPYF